MIAENDRRQLTAQRPHDRLKNMNDTVIWLQYLGYWLILTGLLFPGALRLVRFCKAAVAAEDRLPAPPRVPSDMAVLDHELRLLERAGL